MIFGWFETHLLREEKYKKINKLNEVNFITKNVRRTSRIFCNYLRRYPASIRGHRRLQSSPRYIRPKSDVKVRRKPQNDSKEETGLVVVICKGRSEVPAGDIAKMLLAVDIRKEWEATCEHIEIVENINKHQDIVYLQTKVTTGIRDSCQSESATETS